MGKQNSGYILSIDQSTQGTKALLYDAEGCLIARADQPHRQIVNKEGWVSHDPEEIYQNVLLAVRGVVTKAGIDKGEIAGLGISNQRETSAAWDRTDGKPVADAIVWQCSRAKEICERIGRESGAIRISEITGIRLSPYFPASKFAWFLENVDGAREKAKLGELCLGTMDSWLVYKLTGGERFCTDYSNASRTQLFDITRLAWDEETCGLFDISSSCLAQVCGSDENFGETDLEGYLEKPIPIHAVLGDSHGALFGQGCLEPGMVKATYGTGSSIMMNVGTKPIFSTSGLVTSLAWGLGGTVEYVLEGNINYTGAVISWLKDSLGLVASPGETEELARTANPEDRTYLVPAFSGLGAPYWDSEATAVLSGMTRTTGKAEIAKAALDSIAYQITDIVRIMEKDSGLPIKELRADGGPTKNRYLMQFQSDLTGKPVQVSALEELSGTGAAYAAGMALGIYDRGIFGRVKRSLFMPQMETAAREEKYEGWRRAVRLALSTSADRSQ